MSSSSDIASQIQSTTHPVNLDALQSEVRNHLDGDFGDLDVLLGRHAGPSSRPSSSRGPQKRKRTLREEIGYWEQQETAAAKELEETSVLLPDLLDKTQGRLQDFLSAAQSLSLERYATADKLSHLISELSSTSAEDDHDLDGLGGQSKKGQTVLEQMEVLQSELERLEAGLIWAAALEQVMGLSEQILDPRSHRPSPLATLPRYHALNGLVVDMEATLRRKEPPLPVSPPPLFDDPPRDYDEQFARHHEPITTERMDKKISTLLVTVGSTLFPALTDQVLSSPFLDHLSTQGVQRLVVQYGRADVRLPNGMLPELNGGARFTWKDMIVEVMRFTDDFEGLVKQSDRVISHAGSGSILTVLRTPKPLLVVPNTSLMDNHQAELADALGQDRYVAVSTVDDLQENLAGWLTQVALRGVRPFPGLEKGRFRRVLDQTAGFEP